MINVGSRVTRSLPSQPFLTPADPTITTLTYDPRSSSVRTTGPYSFWLLASDWILQMRGRRRDGPTGRKKGLGIYLFRGFLPAGLQVGSGCISLLKATPPGPPSLGCSNPFCPCFFSPGVGNGSLVSPAPGASTSLLVSLHSAYSFINGALTRPSLTSPLEHAINFLLIPRPHRA